MPHIVEIKNATRRYGTRAVLEDVDLSLTQGEMVGIIGPNGGGKSTLLLLMSGLIRPSDGTVTIDGVPSHELARKQVGTVGLVTARPGVYPLLTGWENLEHFGGLFRHDPDEVRKRAKPLVETFELSDTDMNARVSTWSTGMQQKLSLVRALMVQPKLLLLDEPTANLDPLAAQELWQEVRRRADDGLTCVLVTHDLPAAESLCDRVLLVAQKVRRELEVERREIAEGPLLTAWRSEVGQ